MKDKIRPKHVDLGYRRFVKDWIPFIALFLSYEVVYAIEGKISGVVHIVEPLDAELRIFGVVPSLVLQQSLRDVFLDYFCGFFYSLHFILPLVFAFMVWRWRHDNFWKYTTAFAVCNYAALLTFLVYPTAPPYVGVAGVTRILLQMDHSLGVPLYRTIFNIIPSDPFAAFPSLHSAYPWLISLYAFKIWKRKAWPVLVFPFGVWFSAVYLGEHYVIDVIGGIAYATCAFIAIEKLIPFLIRHVHKS